MSVRMGRRVYAGVAGLGLACVAASLVGDYFVRSIVTSNEDVSGHLMPVLGALLDAQQGFGAIRFSTTRALVVTATGRVEEVAALWAERERALMEAEEGLASFARYPMNAEEAALWTEVRPAFSEFIVENGRVWSAIRSGDLAQAEQLEEIITRRFASQLLMPFEELVEFQKRHAASAAVRASSASALATRVLLAIMATTMVAAVAIGVNLVRSESELVASEERLRLFVEHAPAAIAMLDHEMRYVAVSHRWVLDYRLGEPNLKGRSHYDVFPEISERSREIHSRCLAGAVERCDADPFPRGDGTIDWVRWEIRPWLRANGKVGGIMLFSEIITESKLAADALRESEEKLRLALDSARMGAWDWNFNSGDFRWTDRCGELVGLRPGNAASYDVFLRALHEGDRERVDRSVRDALTAKTDFDAEMRVPGPSGVVRWVAAKGRGSYDAEGHAIRMSGVVHDITEARQRTDELREALAHVKTLSGLLPICIYCKKIRDDQGYWERIERYISAHTDAFFSHGMCPECFEKHYGA